VLFRAPLVLYRLGLGRLLGRRFVYLEHTGRRSGKPRQTVLEVVDRIDGSPVVVAAFGRRTDWLRNLEAHPQARIVWGATKGAVVARRLPTAEARDVFVRYRDRYPRAARMLGRRLGLNFDDPDALAASLPVVHLALSGG